MKNIFMCLRFWKKSFQGMKKLWLVMVFLVTWLVVGNPFEQGDLYMTFKQEYKWSNFLLGVVFPYLILIMYLGIEMLGDIYVVRFKSRVQYLYHLMIAMAIPAFVISAFSVISAFVLGSCVFRSPYQWGSLTKEFGLTSTVAIMWLLIRTILVTGLLLWIFGMIYIIIFSVGKRMIYGVIVVSVIQAIEASVLMKDGNQFLMKYAFPIPDKFYFNNEGFFAGCLFMISALLFLACIFYVVLSYIDFGMRKKKGE